jgi:hypothetical protein
MPKKEIFYSMDSRNCNVLSNSRLDSQLLQDREFVSEVVEESSSFEITTLMMRLSLDLVVRFSLLLEEFLLQG